MRCAQLAAALARHLNNALIHLGNEAAHESRAHRHHAELLPYAPFMRWLKDMDEKAFDALAKVRLCIVYSECAQCASVHSVECVQVYVGTWARVYERELRAACEAARAALAASPPDRAEEPLDNVSEAEPCHLIDHFFIYCFLSDFYFTGFKFGREFVQRRARLLYAILLFGHRR